MSNTFLLFFSRSQKQTVYILFLCVDHRFLVPQLQFHRYTLYHQHAQIRLIAIVVRATVVTVRNNIGWTGAGPGATAAAAAERDARRLGLG